MKYLAMGLLLLSSGCSDLTPEEKKLVGLWEWSVTQEKYEESGFLNLKENRTHIYNTISRNPTETIQQNKLYVSGYWRLNNQDLCVATEYQARTLFSEAIVEKETCLWGVKNDQNGNLKIYYKGQFIRGEIMAELKQ